MTNPIDSSHSLQLTRKSLIPLLPFGSHIRCPMKVIIGWPFFGQCSHTMHWCHPTRGTRVNCVDSTNVQCAQVCMRRRKVSPFFFNFLLNKQQKRENQKIEEKEKKSMSNSPNWMQKIGIPGLQNSIPISKFKTLAFLSSLLRWSIAQVTHTIVFILKEPLKRILYS